MKKFFLLTALIAAGLALFSVGAAAEQRMPGVNTQTAKTLVMRASWKPGSGDRARADSQSWKLIQFGNDFEAVENDEIVTPKGAECLFCHEFTYAALAGLTVDYVDRWGANVNPHIYVDEQKANPHQGDKVVPDCLKCHEEHALPTPASAPARPELGYCYACHHDETFEACDTCH